MAIYDKTASASTAVTAFLAQFKVAANGDITYIAGSHTFHVWWLHRALQKIAWDFAISGDDELNLTKPNPSESEALGTIITLKDHTANYGISYNITDTVAQYLFGGSVEQGAVGSVTKYGGLIVLGSVASATYLEIIQNATVLTSHWGTGKNQTDSQTLLRCLVKIQNAGSEIDNSVVNVKANTWGDSFAVWQTTLGLGEKVAAINTFSDPQNDTAAATVAGYTITKSEGYKLIDVDGAGDKPFIGEWSYGTHDKKALYEYVKWLMRYGTAETLYGMDLSLWTGRLYDCTIGSGTGTWVQNESLSWGSGATAGTGHLVGVEDTAGATNDRLILHLDTGVAPVDTLTVTGNAAATGVLSADSTNITSSSNLLGVFTGTAWIGADGMGFVASELGFADSVKDLDGNILSPPNNVDIVVTVTAGASGDDPHVFLAEKHSVNNAPDYEVYTAAAGNTTGNGTLIVQEAIDADTPAVGTVLILSATGTTYEAYDYSSWTSSTFTLTGTLTQDFTLNDHVFVAALYKSATGGGVTKTASNTLIYLTDIDMIGWVRHGDPASPDKPVPIAGTVTSAGLALTVVLDSES